MSYTAKPIALDLTKRYRQRIARIGIELEGGWLKLPEGCQPVRDGSIRDLRGGGVALTVEEEALRQLYESANRAGTLSMAQANSWQKLINKIKGVNLAIGEVPSPALTISQWEEWLTRFFPSHANSTCGMHVHIHLGTDRPHTYSRLMVEEYPATIIAEFLKWAKEKKLPSAHPMWARLRGQSEYCQHTFWPDLQAHPREKEYDHHRPGNRYSVVNYCYGRFQTAECRLLPMFYEKESKADLATSIEAIKLLLQITNAFLFATKGREPKIQSSFIVDDDHHYEEIIECV